MKKRCTARKGDWLKTYKYCSLDREEDTYGWDGEYVIGPVNGQKSKWQYFVLSTEYLKKRCRARKGNWLKTFKDCSSDREEGTYGWDGECVIGPVNGQKA